MESPGIGPSTVQRLMHDHSLRLAAGLAVAVAIPVAILFYFQFRSISALSQTSALVLRQLSQETSDGVTKVLVDALRTVRVDVLLKIGQRQSEPLDLPFIANTFEQGLIADPFVDRFYVWSDVTTEHRGDVLAFDRTHHEFIVNPPEGALLVKQFQALASEQRAIAIFDGLIGDRRTHFQGQLRFTFTRDRLTSFVALAVDAERLRRDFVPALVAEQVRQGGRAHRIPVARRDRPGRRRPCRLPAWRHERAIGSWTNGRSRWCSSTRSWQASRRRKKADPKRGASGPGTTTRRFPQIIASRERPQHAMMAVLAGVMALGVFFVARAAAREVRVAELKSNFVSSVSHDLKTPLALIQLFAETLELGRLKNTDRAHEYYRIINSEARKLTRLINNLLDFSKIEAGLRKYQLEPVNLRDVTRRVVDSLESQFRHNQFSVTVRVPEAPLTVALDPEAAEQALENLLSNAMKYSPEHREIVVEVAGDGRYGVVRVRDRGIGIPPRLQRRDLSEVLPRPDRCRHRPAGHRSWSRHRRPCDACARRLRPG